MTKKIIKHLIMACGCYDNEKEEWINQCGTEHCPLLNGSLKNPPKKNGWLMKSFKSGTEQEED